MFNDKKRGRGAKRQQNFRSVLAVEEAKESNEKKIETQWKSVRGNIKYILKRQGIVTRKTGFLWCYKIFSIVLRELKERVD